jgi:hypothetical protein
MLDEYMINLAAVDVSSPPPSVGRLELVPGFVLFMPDKPLWLHRTMMRLLLGWVWIDK